MNTLQDDKENKRRRNWWSYVYLIGGLYIASCLLLYFGVVGAMFDFLSSGDIHSWKLQPDPHIFERLLSATMTLVLPLCVAFFLMWALVILLGIRLLILDFIQRRRRKK
jgi:cytochrome bd-type quinol oxidase subunit 2